MIGIGSLTGIAVAIALALLAGRVPSISAPSADENPFAGPQPAAARYGGCAR
jgi:hypothetical protein